MKRRINPTQLDISTILQETIVPSTAKKGLEFPSTNDLGDLVATEQLPKNSKSAYGITESLLKSLDYQTLKNIFYGIWNVSIPKEMLSVMNSVEILAFYSGAFIIKSDERLHGHIRQSDFRETTRLIGRKGYAQSTIQRAQIRFRSSNYRIFPISPGSLVKRLENLDNGIKDRFLASVKGPRVYSNEDDSILGRFNDPNYPDGHAKSAYIVHIMRDLKSKQP